MVKLSKRLQAVADLVRISKTAADIGTDHGYIPIYLVEKGIIHQAFAMDVKAGPLQRAKTHIREHHLEDYIETRLSDGLMALATGEADAIVIAGMGGALMKRILTAGEKTVGAAKELVLQPQSEIEELRYFLVAEGYTILEENMVFEDGKYYPMMRVAKNIEGSDPFLGQEEKTAMKFGPLLLNNRHPVLKQYLCQKVKQMEKALCQIKEKAAPETVIKREIEVQQELADLRLALRVYEEVKYEM